ncbi:MAG: O-antigen ligase family protein [Patescibacteria group bacterium]
MEKTLRNIILAGAFVLPFIFFIVPGDMFFPFITGKNFAFRIIVEIMFGAFSALAILYPAYRPQKSLILISFAAFVGIIAVADIFGQGFLQSFWSNYERMDGLITLLHLLALLIVLITTMRTRGLYERLFDTSIAASIIMSLYGFAQLAGKFVIHQGATRLDGTFGNATYLAVYALFHIFLAALLSLRTGETWKRSWYGVAIALNLFILYHTATRGAMLGLLAGLIVAGAAYVLKGSGKGRKIAAGVIGGVVLVVGLFVAMKDAEWIRTSPVLGRFASISLEDTTTQSRFIIWGMALEGWKERPILGWGQEHFITVFNKYYKPELYKQEPFFDRAHNVFLDWLISGGILGLLAYLAIFFIAAWTLFRSRVFTALEGSVLIGLLAAYFVQNLFVFDNLGSYMLFVMVLGYVALVTKNQEPITKNRKEGKTDETYKNVVIATTLIATLFVLYVLNVKPYQANATLISALSSQEGLQKNLAFFEKALAYNSMGTSEAREQLAQIAARIVLSPAIAEVDKSAFNTLVRREMDEETKAGNNARAELLYGSYLKFTGAYDDAIAHLTRAMELSPGKQAMRMELGSAYLSKGDFAAAFPIMKEAYDLAPENETARDAYALAAVYAGDMKIAQELLVPVYGMPAAPTDEFTRAYAAHNDFATIVSIWQKRIADAQARGADSAQYHVSLAAAYIGTGQRAKAITELRTAISLDSAFKEQGEFYIKEIEAGRNP